MFAARVRRGGHAVERDEREGRASGTAIDNRAVERAAHREYDAIMNLDSQPARYFVAISCTSVAGRLLFSWDFFVAASATCVLGVILPDDFAKSSPRYLQSTPRRRRGVLCKYRGLLFFETAPLTASA